MNLNIFLIDYINESGQLNTYRFVPINEWNRVVVDRLSDIHLDVKGNQDEDIGLFRIYNSDKCDLSKTVCKPKSFKKINDTISFIFEHMYIPLGYGGGSAGIYNFILPQSYKLVDLHIIDPFDKRDVDVSNRKHFRYNVFWDEKKQMQMIEMELISWRGSFSFEIHGYAKINSVPDEQVQHYYRNISFDSHINDFFFDKGIKKSFLKNLKESIIFQPNLNGIGFDFNKFFSNIK